MKCYKCGHKIELGQSYCTHCGSLVQPTHKLMRGVAIHNEEAIITFYKICHGTIAHELLSIGVNQEVCENLVNIVYKKFLEKAPEIPLEEQSNSLVALSDHIGFSYLKDKGISPRSVQVLDRNCPITRAMIEAMLLELQKKDLPIKSKKKPVIKIVVLVVIILGLVGGGSFYGYHAIKKKQANVQKKAYGAVVKEYVNGVNIALVDESLASHESKLKKAYSHTYQPVRLAVKHKTTLNALRCVMIDVTGDGNKELLVGFQDDQGKFVITGMYVSDGKKITATNTNALSKTSQTIILTSNHQVIREENGHDRILTLNKNNHYKTSQSIDDLTSYLKKHKAKTITVKAKTCSSFYKKTSGKSLTAYNNLPSDDKMQKWLEAYKKKDEATCNALAKTMPKETEELATKSMTPAMKAAYKKVVKTYEAKYKHPVEYENFRGYYLSDLDGDGQVELITAYATSDMMPYFDVYKYQNKSAQQVVKKYGYVDSEGSRMCFYAYDGHPGMVGYYRHNGFEETYVLYLSGHQIKTVDYGYRDRHRLDGGFDDYTEIGNELKGHVTDVADVDYSIFN